MEENIIEEMLNVEQMDMKFYRSLESAENLILHNCEYDENEVPFSSQNTDKFYLEKFFSVLY